MTALYLVTYKVYITKDHVEDGHSFVTMTYDATFEESCNNWKKLADRIKNEIKKPYRIAITNVKPIRKEGQKFDDVGYELET